MPEPVDGRILAEALDAEGRRRARLATLLHDYSLQSLLLARQELGEGNGDAAMRALDVGIEQLRETVAGLHPVALEHAGLDVAIEHMVDEAAKRKGLETSIDVEPGIIGNGHEMLLIALARELVGNVERHADAQRLRVALRTYDGQLELEVGDDGRGFDRRGSRGDEGLGLASIEERLKAVGGELDVVSAEGLGTSVTARLPR